jgi:hypothetical protein
MRIDKLWNLIKDNQEFYRSIINVDYHRIEEGDMYYNENGEEFILTIEENIWRVGYMYITEDQEDWGQAEGYEVDWCRQNEKEDSIEKLMLLLNDLKSFLRNSKIEEILK